MEKQQRKNRHSRSFHLKPVAFACMIVVIASVSFMFLAGKKSGRTPVDAEVSIDQDGRSSPYSISLVIPDEQLQDLLPGKVTLDINPVMRRFEEWMDHKKFGLTGVRIAYNPDHRGHGTFASRKFEKGDILMEVPRTATIDLNFIRKLPVAGLMDVMGAINLANSAQMGIFLSYVLFEPEAKELPVVREIQPYLDALPSGDDLPLTWSHEELSRAQLIWTLPNIPRETYPAMVNYLRSRAPSLVLDSKGNIRTFLAVENFLYGQAISASRIFNSVHYAGQKDAEVGQFSNMLPLMDMSNSEQPGPGNRVMTANATHVIFTAGRAIDPGEEIMNTYGAGPFIQYAATYGYVEEYDAATDSLLFRASYGAASFDPSLAVIFTHPAFRGHIGAQPEKWASSIFHYQFTASNVTNIIPFARYSVAVASEGLAGATLTKRNHIAKLAFCTGEPDFKACGISRENEMRAKKWIIDSITGFKNRMAQPLDMTKKVRPEVDRLCLAVRQRASKVAESALRCIQKKGLYEGRRGT